MNDDLKRLIAQYERYTAGHRADFTDEEVLTSLRELLILKGKISEIIDMIDTI